MHYCLCTSLASKPLSDRDLMDIKQKLLVESDKLGLTGLMVFHRNNFIHYYEGDKSALDNVLSILSKDKHHISVKKISSDALSERQFSACAMELRVLDKDPLFSAIALNNDKLGIKRQINDCFMNIT